MISEWRKEKRLICVSDKSYRLSSQKEAQRHLDNPVYGIFRFDDPWGLIWDAHKLSLFSHEEIALDTYHDGRSRAFLLWTLSSMWMAIWMGWGHHYFGSSMVFPTGAECLGPFQTWEVKKKNNSYHSSCLASAGHHVMLFTYKPPNPHVNFIM